MPLPAKMTAAARIERRSRTCAFSRAGSRSELQVITRYSPGAAASSTPRTTSEKYGSVMSWTMTPTMASWLFRSPRASAFGT
jgi:hypothetical protein